MAAKVKGVLEAVMMGTCKGCNSCEVCLITDFGLQHLETCDA